MKRTFSVIALVLAFSLTACSEEETRKNIFNIQQKMAGKDGRAIILPPPVAPQPPEFPRDTEIQAKIAENLAYINSKIVEKDGKTTYYFVEQKDKDGKNTYPLTDDKSKADYYRVILGKTADGYCAVHDFYANGNKQKEPFIEQDINYCNRFDSDKPQDSLIAVYYDKEQKITGFYHFDTTNKQLFSFSYDNGNKDSVDIYDLSDNSKLTEFHFNKKSGYKSAISIIEFNGEEIVKNISFSYLNTHLKDIRLIEQYDHIAQNKKQIMWFPQVKENVGIYYDENPEYEANNKKIFEQRKKWMKQAKEDFKFRLSQNSHNK